MRKVNVEIEKCENYKRNTTMPATLTLEACLTCHFMLFACCWFDERKEKTVTNALDGFDSAKQGLHRKLMKGED